VGEHDGIDTEELSRRRRRQIKRVEVEKSGTETLPPEGLELESGEVWGCPIPFHRLEVVEVACGTRWEVGDRMLSGGEGQPWEETGGLRSVGAGQGVGCSAG
jgi:hypothetical protein